MKTRQIFVCSFITVMIALAFAACPPEPNPGSVPGTDPGPVNPPNITYTVTQTGGTDGTTDSTDIKFTFSASIDSLNLTAADITVGGTAAKGTAALGGSGTTWTLNITVSSAGTATVSIKKTGIEPETKHVTVYKAGTSAPTLTGITASYTGTATIYPTTQLDNLKAGLTVTAQYSGGGDVTLSQNEYTLSGTLTVGSSAVTVTYEGKTTTFNVNVTAVLNKTLTGITLNTNSVVKAYIQNERLDLSGLVVTANYSDGSSAAVNGYTASPANGEELSTIGTITVTIDYNEGAVNKSGTFTVDVIDPTIGTQGLAYQLINDGTAYSVRKGSVTGGEVIIPATYNGLPVTEIGSANDANNEGAFQNCAITIITIPASVTSIGEQAFYGCTNLTTVTFATGSQLESIGKSAFQGCGSPTIITIPASVTSIGINAFNNCTSLTNIIIDNDRFAITQNSNWGHRFPAENLSVTFKKNPGDYAFAVCLRLTSVTIVEGVTSIGDYAFYHCTSLTDMTIPASVTSIGERAFSGCTSLTDITIPASVTSIGDYTFQSSSLATVTFATGSKLEIINREMFSGLTNLTTVTFAESSLLESIGEYAFSFLTNLTTVTFATGSQLESIGKSAFHGCTGLTSITIPASVTSIGESALQGCGSLISITIPASVTSIGEQAFYGCTNLTTVTFATGSQLESIGKSAFQGCGSLTIITIPASVTSIGSSAFEFCAALASVTIPASVTSIGVWAFYGWTSSQTINVQGKNQAAADTAWGSSWRSSCNATINYLGS